MRRFSTYRMAKAAILGLGIAAVLGAALPARADDDDWEHHHHKYRYGPYVYYEPGYYVAPPPVIYAPPPVVYAPPPPVVYAPPPVAYAPPLAGLNIVVPIRLH